MKQAYPILEFDSAREALLEPHRLVKPKVMPEHCVLCFFQDVITKLAEEKRIRVLATQRSEMGSHPVYEMTVNGRPVALAHPGVGAPLAAAMLEEILYGGDDCSGKEWDHRQWHNRASIREDLLYLAAEACQEL